MSGDLGAVALRAAQAGYEVFPLHAWNCGCHRCETAPKQRGKAPLTVHGVLEATCDRATVAAWWRHWPTANIGGRVPAGVVVVDIDPRENGDIAWAALTAEHTPVHTRAAWSGRDDGGFHLYLRHPGDKLRGKIVAGVDLRGRGNYTVLPPSLHPATGHPYRWDDVTISTRPHRTIRVSSFNTARTSANDSGSRSSAWRMRLRSSNRVAVIPRSSVICSRLRWAQAADWRRLMKLASRSIDRG